LTRVWKHGGKIKRGSFLPCIWIDLLDQGHKLFKCCIFPLVKKRRVQYDHLECGKHRICQLNYILTMCKFVVHSMALFWRILPVYERRELQNLE
jgi:hypothetical protein